MWVLVFITLIASILLLGNTILISLVFVLGSSLIAGIAQNIYARRFAQREFEVREDEFGIESLAAPLTKKAIHCCNAIGSLVFVGVFLICILAF